MANRRCFSKKIVRSDDFLEMPVSSRELYFQLGMEADDRGYVNNAVSVIRSCGATVGDLQHLIDKRFILLRGEKLLLIKAWRVNNTIQPTRLTESQYVNDLKSLFFKSKEDLSYTEQNTGLPVLGGLLPMNEDDKESC